MIKKATMSWTAKTLVNQMTKGNIDFDTAIQRGKKWDLARKQLFIDSLLNGYPTPSLFMVRVEQNKYESIDGKQRSTAVQDYFADFFPLAEGTIVEDDEGNEHDLSGLIFSGLPEFAQDLIKDYNFAVYYFENLPEEEKQEMFYRWNNGKPLSAVELTRVKAPSLKKFQEVASHELINLAVTEKGRANYNHENLVMQAWAVCYGEPEEPSFETKTFRPLIENADVTDEQVNKLRECLDYLLLAYNFMDVEDKLEKKIRKRIVTRTHTVALIKAAFTALERGYDMNLFESFVQKFLAGTKHPSINEQYNASCSGGRLASKEKVTARMNSVVEAMEAFYEDNAVPLF